MLAAELAAHDHDVTWWTSIFDHQTKTFLRSTRSGLEVVGDRLRVAWLGAWGYQRNVSVGRVVDHSVLGLSFMRRCERQARPDVLVVSFPPIELAFAAVSWAAAHRIPVLLDIRDLWPDIWAQQLPEGWLRELGCAALAPWDRLATGAIGSASGLVAISDTYLDWGLRRAGRRRSRWDFVLPLGYPEVHHGESELRQAAQRLAGLGVDPSKKSVWFIGSLGTTYDIETVLAAAQGLRDPEVQVVISGDGEFMSAVRSAAAACPSIVATGWLGPAEIVAMSRQAWVGLAAYSRGAPQVLPNKIFEYLAGGVPIIASLGGETQALLSQEGVGRWYEAGRPDSLRGVVTALLNDTVSRDEMSMRARVLFSARYSESAIYPRFRRHLEELAAVSSADQLTHDSAARVAEGPSQLMRGASRR
jgi:glycosyltransferase involved in cell wall biosynthesis